MYASRPEVWNGMKCTSQALAINASNSATLSGSTTFSR